MAENWGLRGRGRASLESLGRLGEGVGGCREAKEDMSGLAAGPRGSKWERNLSVCVCVCASRRGVPVEREVKTRTRSREGVRRVRG